MWYSPAAVGGFAEKDFYLEEFRGRTLVLAADRDVLQGREARRRLASVVRDLVKGGSRVVVVLGRARAADLPAADGRRGGDALRRWRRWLGLPRVAPRRSRRVRGDRAPADVVSWPTDAAGAGLVALWSVLRVRAACLVVTEAGATEVGCEIASGFRVTKLVLIDRVGGLVQKRGGEALSYLDGASLDALLAAGEAEFQGFGDRRGLLTQIDRVLEAGVSSVNLCRIGGLARELFTYEGSGTFISRDDHCRVAPLSIDDFDEVERLMGRGQVEGLLRPRTPEQIAELLLDGFGAWIGPGHLAGVAALRTWPAGKGSVGEISGLYTFTRFKGEGVGGRLVERLLAEARDRRMSYVFAVTTSERAARFFVRKGFEACTADDVPPGKWEDYDPARRSRARVFRIRPSVASPRPTPTISSSS